MKNWVTFKLFPYSRWPFTKSRESDSLLWIVWIGLNDEDEDEESFLFMVPALWVNWVILVCGLLFVSFWE